MKIGRVEIHSPWKAPHPDEVKSEPIFGRDKVAPPEGGPIQIKRAEKLGEVATARALGGDRLAQAGVLTGSAAETAEQMAIKEHETGEHQIPDSDSRVFATDKQEKDYRAATAEMQAADPAVLEAAKANAPDERPRASA